MNIRASKMTTQCENINSCGHHNLILMSYNTRSGEFRGS
jgi:hypothetical protein